MSRNVTDSKHELVAAALATGSSVTDVANRFDISRKTIHRWMAESEFRDRISELRSELLSEAAGRSAGAICEALTTLQEILTDGEQPGSVRVSAARCLIDATMKIRESKDLDD
jgi:transposase-like protein